MIIVAETQGPESSERYGIARDPASWGYYVVCSGRGHRAFEYVVGTECRRFRDAMALCKELSGTSLLYIRHELRHFALVRQNIQRAHGLLNRVRRRT